MEKCRTKAIAELLGFALGTSFFSLAFLGKGKASGQQVYPASTRSKGVEEGGGSQDDTFGSVPVLLVWCLDVFH